MNILCDNNASTDLYYSLYLLFEKRLNGQLFVPEGSDWFEKGFIKANYPAEVGYEKHDFIDGIHYFYKKMEENTGDYIQKAITLKEFLKMDFDIVIATYKDNEETFYNLTKEYKPNTIFIRLIANVKEIPLGDGKWCKNILLPAHAGRLYPMPPNTNYLTYFPENYEGYSYIPPINHKIITSFVNNLTDFPYDLKLWNELKSLLPDFTFNMYGGKCDDGIIPHNKMPQTMKNAAFIWHVKSYSGGGFTARQAMMCGRPLIIKKEYSRLYDILENNCYKPKINCIDLSQISIQECANIIRELSEPDSHIEICKKVAEEAEKDMNPKKEAEKVREWLKTLGKPY